MIFNQIIYILQKSTQKKRAFQLSLKIYITILIEIIR